MSAGPGYFVDRYPYISEVHRFFLLFQPLINPPEVTLGSVQHSLFPKNIPKRNI
jgi:hypothetical protein